MPSTKEKRDLLFRRTRPHIRPYTPEDFWVLWAAYDLGSFPGLQANAGRDEFAAYIELICRSNSACLLIEDDCKYFRGKRGPVAFVAIKNDGWKVQPTIDFFKWTTPRMKLRALVAAFQMARYSKEIGVVVVSALAGSVKALNRMRRYGLLFPVGRIPDGNSRGDEFLYYLRGKKAA